MSKPGWMDESLEEEWIDQNEQDMSIYHDNDAPAHGLHIPHAPQEVISRGEEEDQDGSGSSATAISPQTGGTFLIREDVQHEPVTPAKRLPGKGKLNPFAKSFFSPLALERMFDPPSPPVQKTKPARTSSTLVYSHLPPEIPSYQDYQHGVPAGNRNDNDGMPDEIIASDIPNLITFDGRMPSTGYNFTFRAPIGGSRPPLASVDPRLRLFQTYDTYTKDHLSALVDTIDVKSAAGSPSEDGYSRSSKRIRLSPPESEYPSRSHQSLFSARSTVSPRTSRPNSRRDYVGESRSLMQQIKNNRSFSVGTTLASDVAGLSLVEEDEEEYEEQVPSQSPFGPSSASSSMAYRLQAASLMAQIKFDVQDDLPDGKENEDLHTTRRDDLGEIKSTDNLDLREPSRRMKSPDEIDCEPNLENRLSQKFVQLNNSGIGKRSRSPPQFPSSVPIIQIQPASSTIPLPKVGDNIPVLDRTTSVPSSIPQRGAQNLEVDRNGRLTPPLPQQQNQAQADLARFIMSSTAQSSMFNAIQRSHSGTSSSSIATAGSGVKHAGSLGAGVLRTIAPEEVGPINAVGDMVWDPERMVWAKNRQRRSVGTDEDISEDVFRDIESLQDRSEGDHEDARQGARDESGESSEDDDTDEPNKFVGDPVRHLPNQYRDSDSEGDEERDGDEGELQEPEYLSSARTNVSGEASRSDLQRNFESTLDDEDEDEGHHFSENPDPVATSNDLAAFRNALRSIPMGSQLTPHSSPYPNTDPTPHVASNLRRSALKQTPIDPAASAQRETNIGPSTPISGIGHPGHRRSVSFSDGKKDGKIIDLIKSRGLNEVSLLGGDEGDGKTKSVQRSMSLAPSTRTKRIDGMLTALAEGSMESTPSKAEGHRRTDSSVLVPLSARSSAFSHTHSESRSETQSVSLVAHGSEEYRQPPRGTQTTTYTSRARHTVSVRANQTILTECSFAVTQDKLVQVITQVQPYEPHWENLPEIDLSGRAIESVTRMKEFLPSLVRLDLHDNQLAYLSGVPSNVRNLRASNNLLSSLTAYNHLRNLETLDISNNGIETFTQLHSLQLLRELRADGNSVTSVEGLEHMNGLEKLSLKKNKITQINFSACSWTRLETLDLSSNCLSSVVGLSSLSSLLLLNLDHNRLTTLTTSNPVPRLRVLRLSDNRLCQLNVAQYPNLRTLYIDGNRLTGLTQMTRLSKLENLSLRNQRGGQLRLASSDVRDIKRLYLSGNPENEFSFLAVPCYNLVYLELAGCRIETLPTDLATMVPNVRVLNLNYNFISDASPLQGLVRLKRLTLVGSRLRGTKGILKALQKMPDMEMVDLRMNPATLGWYLPILVRDIPGALQPLETSLLAPLIPTSGDREAPNYSAVRLHPFSVPRDVRDNRTSVGRHAKDTTWENLDAKFRRDLPDSSYLGRLAYRGMVMRACPNVRVIDGVTVADGEREKAEKLLTSILLTRKADGVKH